MVIWSLRIVRVFIRPGWRGATSGVVSSDVRGIDHQR